MARPKKIKEPLPPTSEDDTLPFIESDKIIEDAPTDEALPESSIQKTVQSEVLFLEKLLETIVSGSWHGPAACIIRERLKLLKG